MTQCPYPQTIRDEDSGVEVINSKYQYWHEGYEAHKFEDANMSIKMVLLAHELEDEIIRVKQLRIKLRASRDKKKIIKVNCNGKLL